MFLKLVLQYLRGKVKVLTERLQYATDPEDIAYLKKRIFEIKRLMLDVANDIGKIKRQ
jgi:hypothetical protein